MSRLLVVMGSGETAPTMVKPHRAVFERVTGPAVLLDTPYGFQSNADDISARAVRYFDQSVGHPVDVLSWRRAPTDPVARERCLAALRGAGWVFAGPGSPTYTLRAWRETAIPDLLADKLSRDGVILFASAAALTLGSHTVPVYEIYKAGIEPHWAPGLNLLEAALGFPAVLIPHYDNAEGGNHDTRYCYLGEERLTLLEAELPPDRLIIGVDEHTAVVFDLDAKTATVSGNGLLTLRRAGASTAFPSGSVLSFADLAAGPTAGLAIAPVAGLAVAPARSPLGSAEVPPLAAQPSLRGAADDLDARFGAALAARDVDACVAAVLELEQAIVDWSGDTETNDSADYPRSVLRGMVVRLGELASRGAADPAKTMAPFVDALVELRARARLNRDYPTSDTVRDRLTAAGIELRDSPDGTSWRLIND
jgi:cyanophycinase-like exopeptidase